MKVNVIHEFSQSTPTVEDIVRALNRYPRTYKVHFDCSCDVVLLKSLEGDIGEAGAHVTLRFCQATE